MISPIIWKKLTNQEQFAVLQRPAQENSADFQLALKTIIESVRIEGDAACKQYTAQFDGVKLEQFAVEQNEINAARTKVKDETFRAMQRAIQQLTTFHLPQLLENKRIETSPGIICESQVRPIEKVGFYIPGGTAPLISTVFMLGIPAKIAGCPIRILCSPPGKDGHLDPHILLAAKLCGIEKIYKIGGAQAIAAMAYGTETIPKVNKIFGPGNSWVTQAKIKVSQDTAGALYDLPAGPSEVMIIADDSANPVFIAADLLSQLEHGVDSQAILLCTSKNLIDQVIKQIENQLMQLTRKDMIKQSLTKSRLIYIENIDEAINIANDYAPEHLILQISKPRNYLEKIDKAGSVFIGPWSPVAVGDYASGTNHVLPTDGFARSLSGLSVKDFMKTMTVQELSKEGFLDISKTIIELTKIEKLDAHQRSIELRFGE